MRWCQLGMVLLLFGLPCSAGADADLDRARALVMQGKHGLAREAARAVLRRNLHDPEALQIVVATSCELGDEAVARLAYKRLAHDVQSMAARHCLRRGIRLTGATTRAAPSENTPNEDLPQGTTPQETTPQETTPQETTPQETTPQETTPQETTPKKTTRSTRLPWRVAFWTGLTLTVVTLVSGSVLAASVYGSLESDKEDAIVVYRQKTGDKSFGSSRDVCAEAVNNPEAASIHGICEEAHSRVTTSNVLFGVSIAFAALSGYLYYRAYIKKEEPPLKVSFSPTLSPTSGGLSLRLTF